MKWLLVLAMAFGSVACQVRTIPVPTPVVEQAVEEPYVEPSGTPDCQPTPEVVLDVQKTGPSSVRLHASGLQPGEIPRVIFSASSQGFGAFGDAGVGVRGADELGEYSLDLSGLVLGYGSPDAPTTASWDVRLIHARGVACATITLP